MTDDGFLSPESTATSLLASSGRLRSTQHSESSQTIRYKGKTYESASDALDAYIDDFQKNQLTSGQSTGQLTVPKTLTTSCLSHARFKNKDVLKESLTEKELNYMSLPVGPRHQTSDRLSLSTDDLLVLPCDGSLPVTHTSAFLSQTGIYSSQTQLNTQSKTTARSQPALKPRSNPPRQNYCHWSSARPKPGCTKKTALKQSRVSSLSVQAAKRAEKRGSILPDSCFTHRHASLDASEDAAVVHHYPRWMTSQRSEMDFSGITSVPELKYPTWLQECDTPEEPRNGKPTTHPSFPSWLGQLEESYQEIYKKKEQTDFPDHKSVMSCTGTENRTQTTALLQNQANLLSLRELRLQFAEQLALEDEDQRHDRSQPFRDDKIECLIQRAEQALNSPSLGITHQSQRQSSPGATEEVLEADRSWDNPPVAFKSPVPVGVSDTPQTSEEPRANHREETLCSSSSGYSSRKHPGPVEALKQMLFSLQAVEQKVAQDNSPVGEDTTGTDKHALLSQEQQTEEVSNVVEDDKSGPGGESLQRALHHLGRLKHLVDDIKEKKGREQRVTRNHHVT